MSSVETSIAEVKRHLTSLTALLLEEREALGQRDAQLLADVTQRKEHRCDLLQQALANLSSLAANLNDLPAANTAKQELLQLAQQAKESNLVNGKILHRSRQSLSELKQIICGNKLDGLYGESGRAQASQPDQPTIAKA